MDEGWSWTYGMYKLESLKVCNIEQDLDGGHTELLVVLVETNEGFELVEWFTVVLNS